ncbi:MAG TPA: alpha/beta hydrolase [Rhodanobacteraceae bacterium]|nr:alpha/beta hydrolase [Rhodanobacteraceae bacterium]
MLAVAVAIAWFASPWPRVALIRYFFNRGGMATERALARHVPGGVAADNDIAYRDGDPAARMDVFFPARIEHTTEQLPTIVWVHGGGWIAGHRSDIANYAKILAAHGYTTVALDYAVPPQAIYPTAVEEVNAALGYLSANAARLHVDPDHFVLAGDSAGAQIAAQVANIITNPDYARAMDIAPAIRPSQLAAMVLACGVYDMPRAGRGGLYAKFFSAVFWAYSGRRDFRNAPRLRLMSVAEHLMPAFPPSFITAGNGDPLVAQSSELAQRLESLGVPVDALLYAPDHQPRLPHEYQFNLDSGAGRAALQRIVAFLHARVGDTPHSHPR